MHKTNYLFSNYKQLSNSNLNRGLTDQSSAERPDVPRGLSDQNWKQRCLRFKGLCSTAAKERKKNLSKHSGSLRLNCPSGHLLLVTAAACLSDSTLTASCLCRPLWQELSRSVCRQQRRCCVWWLSVEVKDTKKKNKTKLQLHAHLTSISLLTY